MKRVILSLVFILTFFFLSSLPSFAQDELTIKEATDSPELSKISKRVEYQLPYPGLLPDSPLYFAKALRDAIVDFLIASPLKKADFYLLQADKRLNAGVYLFKKDKSKASLAESTISKGENYFEKAIAKAREAKTQGSSISDIAERLFQAAKKHQEVIYNLQVKADSKNKESLKSLLKRVKNLEKQASKLTSK